MSWWVGLLSHHIQMTGSCALESGRNLVVEVVAPEMSGCWGLCRAGLVIHQLTRGCREGKALRVVYFPGSFILAKGCKKAVCMQPCAPSAFQLGNHNPDIDDLPANSQELKPIWAGQVVSKLAEH